MAREESKINDTPEYQAFMTNFNEGLKILGAKINKDIDILIETIKCKSPNVDDIKIKIERLLNMQLYIQVPDEFLTKTWVASSLEEENEGVEIKKNRMPKKAKKK